ncbi:MAG: SPFH domain-containing protein, partial [Candidatus Heimdallarchaeota archaeon]
MGIYVKVIADYLERKKDFKTGDELFITGKEQKIYYPRPEHALISYDNQKIHYAVALPEGEGRYVLNKDSGEVKLVRGPKMFMADPRKEVIVKRLLDKKRVRLMYPDNTEASDYNERLEMEIEEQGGEDAAFLGSRFTNISYAQSRGSVLKSKAAATFDTLGDMSRKTAFTKPRTITLDNKYEGAVKIGIWPGFAVQIVKQNGKRQVVEGPETLLLEYDEYLDVLALSTGKPKLDHNLQRTVYLQTKNNVVSDIVEVETEDFVKISIRVSYRVNFVAENSIWFNVSNYVKLMTQHLRSLIRNEIKRHTVEKFNQNSTDIIRNVVLGEKTEGKARGRMFKENNAEVYDVEVLNIEIQDYEISELLQGAQRNTVRKNLEIKKREQDLEFTKKIEGFKREEVDEKQKTAIVLHDANLTEIDQTSKQDIKTKESVNAIQELLNQISDAELNRDIAKHDEDIRVDKFETELRIQEVKEKMDAVAPKLVEALGTLGTVSLTEILAKNLTYRTHSIF